MSTTNAKRRRTTHHIKMEQHTSLVPFTFTKHTAFQIKSLTDQDDFMLYLQLVHGIYMYISDLTHCYIMNNEDVSRYLHRDPKQTTLRVEGWYHYDATSTTAPISFKKQNNGEVQPLLVSLV